MHKDGIMEQPSARDTNVSNRSDTKPRNDSIRIVYIQTKSQYCKVVLLSYIFGFVHIAVGAVNIFCIAYSIHMHDSHIGLCTVAYHLFCLEAISAMIPVNGWSAPMRLRHRKMSHVMFQIIGMVMGIVGTLLACNEKMLNLTSAHALSGFSATTMSFLATVFGVFALFTASRAARGVHIFFGLPTFILSSVSLILAFLSKSFEEWAGKIITILLITFVAFYTLFVVALVIVRCIIFLS